MKRMTNIDTGFVCHCARIRHSELLEIFSESARPSYEYFKERYGIGGQCASCEYEVKAILDEYVGTQGLDVVVPRPPSLAERAREWRERFGIWLARQRKPAKDWKINSHACMFFIVTKELRSSLVVSNVNNPESNLNPNHGTVYFRVRIYDSAGQLIRETGRFKCLPNETKELQVEDLFEIPPGDLIGSAYVDYYDLEITNTLRPYCVMNSFDADGRVRTRQHYHDKLYTGIIPGFVQCPSVLMPERECWLAMVNCTDADFDVTYHLRIGSELRQVRQHFAPRQSAFRSVSEVFGIDVAAEVTDAHFWIESERYVMTYFFWHALKSDVWVGQHH
jgi:bacterioferritin-associated ferredoxin